MDTVTSYTRVSTDHVADRGPGLPRRARDGEGPGLHGDCGLAGRRRHGGRVVRAGRVLDTCRHEAVCSDNIITVSSVPQKFLSMRTHTV